MLDVNGHVTSLIGFDRKKCIFVHIPKAAGVSINFALFQNLGGSHLSIKKYSLIFSKKDFASYYKFSIVRHPCERLYSAFTFLKAGGFNGYDKIWVDENLSCVHSFDDFVLNWLNKQRLYATIHFVPQYEFLTINGKIVVDNIFKLEDMEYCIEELAKRTSTLLEEFRKENKTVGKQAIQMSPSVCEKIYHLYRRDFVLFNYKIG